jgi:hypothetical protein
LYCLNPFVHSYNQKNNKLYNNYIIFLKADILNKKNLELNHKIFSIYVIIAYMVDKK